MNIHLRAASFVVLALLTAQARGAVEGLDTDGFDTRTGKFEAEYPLPPDAETSRMVQLLIKRRASISITPPTRQELWFRGRNVERQQPDAGRPGPGGQPARAARPAAPATKPAEPPVNAAEHVKDPPSYQLYVPESYRPGVLFGVIVFMSPGGRGDVHGDYRELCDRHKLIWIAPGNVGNSRYAPWRRYMALEAAWQAARHFTIDSTRVYVCGTSGGGRVSSEAAIVAPEVFSGGFYVVGCNYYRNLPLPNEPKKLYPGFWNNADPKVLDQAKKDGRYVLLTGSNDFNRQNTKVVYDEGYARDGFAHATYLEVPDMGHSMPPAEWFEKGLEFLDAPLPLPADLYKEAGELERRKKPGEACLAYARAAARGGDAAWVKEAQANADAIRKEYRTELAQVRKVLATPPVDKPSRDRAAAAVRDLRAHYGAMAERDALAFDESLKPKPPTTRPPRAGR